MRRSRANRLQKKAELIVAHEANPEARVQVKREGLAVGKRVMYDQTRIGVVKEMHRDSVVVQQTDNGLLGQGHEIVLREDEVPFASINAVLGDGVLATQRMKPREAEHVEVSPPPRASGYESCDFCSKPPMKVYLVKKWDHEVDTWGVPHLVAACRDHSDESYIPPADPNKAGIMETPALFPELWQMGTIFGEWTIPKTVADRNGKDAEIKFENCWCGKEFGHRGFHRKKEEDDT